MPGKRGRTRTDRF